MPESKSKPSIARIWRGRVAAWMSSHMVYSLRAQTYEKLQSLSLGYYDKRQTGTLVARVTQDVNELQVEDNVEQFFGPEKSEQFVIGYTRHFSRERSLRLSCRISRIWSSVGFEPDCGSTTPSLACTPRVLTMSRAR